MEIHASPTKSLRGGYATRKRSGPALATLARFRKEAPTRTYKDLAELMKLSVTTLRTYAKITGVSPLPDVVGQPPRKERRDAENPMLDVLLRSAWGNGLAPKLVKQIGKSPPAKKTFERRPEQFRGSADSEVEE